MKQEKGISLISLVITIVLMIIIAGTVISVSLGNLNTKNLTSMYTDLKSINDKIAVYYNKYGTLPIKEKFMGSYEFTTMANPNDDEEGYYIIDVNKLDKLILSKKISGTGNDVYIVNTQTHMVYYPEGVELDGEMYYRLPGEYSKLELITDLQMELKANTTDLVNAVTISVTGSSESGMKSYVSASGSMKTYTSGTKNIKESYEVKQNGTYKFTLTNNKGEIVSKTITISNIDNQAPTVELTPNGGTGYVMPSEGNARVRTKIEVTDGGGSTLKTLQYAWSESKTTEPTSWMDFINGQEIEKIDITKASTWYLWTKVIDSAGNRATNIKTSEEFVVSANTEEEYVIKLTPDYTDWTANDITVTATYGSKLTPISLTCTGTSGTDYTVDGTTSVAVKTNNQTVTAKAEDKAGNVITATLIVTKIDKNAPIVTAKQTSVTISKGTSYETSKYFTVEQNGESTMTTTYNVTNTNTLAKGTHTITCTATKTNGLSVSVSITIVVTAPEITPAQVAASPSEYSGKTVDGYTCTNSAGVSTWKIFYADSNNIYLIASDYIHKNYTPADRKGTKPNGSEYKMYFNDIYGHYDGATNILDSSITHPNIKKWMNWAVTYSTSTNTNIRSIAYILDCNVWQVYKDSTYADYAIGSPTVELFAAGYNWAHPSLNIGVSVYNSKGYGIGTGGGNSSYLISGVDTTDSTYLISSTSKANAMWLASGSRYHVNCLYEVRYNGQIGYYNDYYAEDIGFRPIVCLSSDVKLTDNEDGTYGLTK